MNKVNILQVDHGNGVNRNALLKFDVKSGHYNHVAMKTYSLTRLLEGSGFY